MQWFPLWRNWNRLVNINLGNWLFFVCSKHGSLLPSVSYSYSTFLLFVHFRSCNYYQQLFEGILLWAFPTPRIGLWIVSSHLAIADHNEIQVSESNITFVGWRGVVFICLDFINQSEVLGFQHPIALFSNLLRGPWTRLINSVVLWS